MGGVGMEHYGEDNISQISDIFQGDRADTISQVCEVSEVKRISVTMRK